MAKVHNLLRITAGPIFLETPIGEEGESRLVDYIEDKEEGFPTKR